MAIEIIPDDDEMRLVFSSMNLAGSLTGVNIHQAPLGTNGDIIMALSPVSMDIERSIDIAARQELAQAVRSGEAYVSVKTSAYPEGELRGQILPAGNRPPLAGRTFAPALVMFTDYFDPESVAMSISWLDASDPDSNQVNYVLHLAQDPYFVDIFRTEYVGEKNGIAMSVGEIRDLYEWLAPPWTHEEGSEPTVSFYWRVTVTDGSLWSSGTVGRTSIQKREFITGTEETDLPRSLELKGNHPNPFSSHTTITFDLPEQADVSLEIRDMLGRRVHVIPARSMSAGRNQHLRIDGVTLASGIYHYRILAEGRSSQWQQEGRMVRLR